MIGPVVLIVNIASLFLCFRPKYGLLLTLAVFAAYGTAVHFLFNPLVMHTAFAPYGGVIILPLTSRTGHGIGVRSITAFARENGSMLDFSCGAGVFTLRLLMGTPV